ncbi:hypothetical protein [Streptomyces uncialis]|uniref:hypothetical protein n=1 Tax=Streptomyces uncialis TaxID=1048205 RepID=UPI0033EA0475
MVSKKMVAVVAAAVARTYAQRWAVRSGYAGWQVDIVGYAAGAAITAMVLRA